MSEPSLEFISTLLRQIQAEQRTLKAEQIIIHKRLDQIIDRIASFEAIIETRLDQQTILIDMRFDSLIILINEKIK